MNTSQLTRLLTISDPKKETIFGVVGRMRVLKEYISVQSRYASLMPFLTTYYYVTKAAASKYLTKKHYFWSLDEYETFDVYFASLYFTPLLIFLTTGRKVPPWEHYFSYCQQRDGMPFLQMLLGINAHINADLYAALVDLRYKNQSDFFLVNDILLEVTPSVMEYLKREEHDIVGLTGSVFRSFATGEFHTVIERWRSEAWVRASFTKQSSINAMKKEVIADTERIAGMMIKSAGKNHHLAHFPGMLHSLHTISVNRLS